MVQIKSIKHIILILAAVFSLSSCATLVGGTKINAHVRTIDKPNAKIYRNGVYLGEGNVITKIRRRDVDHVNFVVKQKGCKEETFGFRGKTFRGWSLFGTLFWSYSVIPVGVIIDGATGAWWKPNLNEVGIVKRNFVNYEYNLKYKAEPIEKPRVIVQQPAQKDSYLTKSEKLRDLKKLFDEGIINQKEYDHMKAEIIGLKADDSEVQLKESTEEITTTEIAEVESKDEKQEEQVITTKEEEPKEEIKEEKEPELSPEKQEKLNDLDKMLEFGIITEKEHAKMKKKILEQD